MVCHNRLRHLAQLLIAGDVAFAPPALVERQHFGLGLGEPLAQAHLTRMGLAERTHYQPPFGPGEGLPLQFGGEGLRALKAFGDQLL